MEELPDFLNLRGYAASVMSRIRDLREWPINCLIKGRETTFSEFELKKNCQVSSDGHYHRSNQGTKSKGLN